MKFEQFLEKIKKRVQYNKNKKLVKDFLSKYEPKPKKKLLMSNMGGHPNHINIEGIHAIAMKLREYDVEFMICDGICAGCNRREFDKNASIKKWQADCKICKQEMLNKLKLYNITPTFASKYISKNKIKEIESVCANLNAEEIYNFVYENINLGQIAWQSFMRYGRGLIIDCGQLDESLLWIARAYLKGALVVYETTKNKINDYKPDAVFVSHGLYTDFAVVAKVAKKIGINVTSWLPGFEGFFFKYFADMDVQNSNLLKMKESNWEKLVCRELTQKENLALDKYINKRYAPKSEISKLVFNSPEQIKISRETFGFNNDKKIVCLFCHVNWDAAIDLASIYFKTTDEWTYETIKHMITNDTVNWLIRVHPAELIIDGKNTMYDVIKKLFNIKELPPHIKIIDCKDKINSKDLFELIDTGITIFGTIGTELTLLGKNVILAGSPHYAGKGFTIDTTSKAEYFNALKNIANLPPLTSHQIELARKYAYSFFVQRNIPFAYLFNKTQRTFNQADMNFNNLEQLLPNKNAIIDKICNAIATGDDVILELKDLKYSKRF